MTVYDLFLPTFLLLVGYGIWQHNSISIIAQMAAARYCQKEGVQLLDQTVLLKKLRIGRSSHSLFAFRREYTFEFSTIGDRRYPAHIQLLGNRVERIELSPYKVDSPILKTDTGESL